MMIAERRDSMHEARRCSDRARKIAVVECLQEDERRCLALESRLDTATTALREIAMYKSDELASARIAQAALKTIGSE